MKIDKFRDISQALIDNCWNTLFNKQQEYATDEDALANFKQPTSIMQTNQAEVCLFYTMKHIGSMVKIAKDMNKGEMPSKALLEEKVGDYINYGLLFYANALEMIGEEKKKK